MKRYTLILTKDTRGKAEIEYKEVVAKKWLFKGFGTIEKYKADKKVIAKYWLMKLKLYDPLTNSYVKQWVFVRASDTNGKFISVEVF